MGLENLSPEAQQQAIRMYMSQQGGQANPANMSRMTQQLASNPQMAQAAVNLFMNNQATNSETGGGGTAGSRLIDNFLAQDGTGGAPVVPPAAQVAKPAAKAATAPGRVTQQMTGMGTAARGGPDVVPGDTQLAQLPPQRPGELGPSNIAAAPAAPAPNTDGQETSWGTWLSALLGLRALAGKPAVPPPGGGLPNAGGGPADASWKDVPPQGTLPPAEQKALPAPQKQLPPPAPDIIDKATAADTGNYDVPEEKPRVRVPAGSSPAEEATPDKPRVRVQAGSSKAEPTTAKSKTANIKVKPKKVF